MENMCFDIRVKRASHIIALAKPPPSRKSRKYQKRVIELYIHISIWTDFVIFRQLVLQKLVGCVISNFYHQLEQIKQNQLTYKGGIIRCNELSRLKRHIYLNKSWIPDLFIHKQRSCSGTVHSKISVDALNLEDKIKALTPVIYLKKFVQKLNKMTSQLYT